MKKFDIALDVDEVLTPCLEQGCQLLGIDPMRITDWNLRKTELSEEEVKALMLIICSPEFVRNQVPYPGAVEMVQELVNDGHRVMIATAVDECRRTLVTSVMSSIESAVVIRDAQQEQPEAIDEDPTPDFLK